MSHRSTEYLQVDYMKIEDLIPCHSMLGSGKTSTASLRFKRFIRLKIEGYWNYLLCSKRRN